MSRHPNPRRGARLTTSIAAIILASSLLLGATACKPVSRSWAWTAGKTHGAIIETTAGRASLGIYRVPTMKLYEVYRGSSIDVVQDIMWALGKPPELKKTFSFRGHSVTIEFGIGTQALRKLTHHLIYADDNDLRSALEDAHDARDCLAITLISYGRPVSNWTHKTTDCQNGSLG